jgi:putative ABC transport system permease protein
MPLVSLPTNQGVLAVPALPYSLKILWRDRGRFIPATLAVAFSAVLIALQCGLLIGILLCSSVPIDNAPADICLTTRDTTAFGQMQPIPEAWLLRLAQQPEVERVESILAGFGRWHKPGLGKSELCLVVGSRLDEDSLGAIRQLTPALRAQLADPGAVVVDDWDLNTLGLDDSAEPTGEINGHQVRVVGTIRTFQGLNFSWIFCSLETFRQLTPQYAEQPELTVFGLARCRRPEDVPVVVRRLRTLYPEMGVYTGPAFARRVQLYWLFRSKAGTIMVCTVTLALLVGLVVTSQTLYAAELASLREYAMLDSLGIPRRRLVGLVLAKSFWIGVAGVVLSLPLAYALSWAALIIRTQVVLGSWLMAGTAVLTVGMAMASGLVALRPLGHIEPANLLR